MSTENDVVNHMQETFGLSEADYRAAPSWSYSQLKLLPDQPELFYGRFISKEWPFEPTPAMELGTILHGCVLQGLPVPVIPDDVLSASGSRAGGKYKEWCEAHPGPSLKMKEAEPIKQMIRSIFSNKSAAKLLRADGLVEVPVFDYTVDPPIKGRMDKVCKFGDSEFVGSQYVILDLKTTNDPTPEAFSKQVWNQKYHRQAAFYRYLLENRGDYVEAVVFIAVRNEPPYECFVYECSPELEHAGRIENETALADLAKRLDSGDWQSIFANKINRLDLPTWAKPKENRE